MYNIVAPKQEYAVSFLLLGPVGMLNMFNTKKVILLWNTRLQP